MSRGLGRWPRRLSAPSLRAANWHRIVGPVGDERRAGAEGGEHVAGAGAVMGLALGQLQARAGLSKTTVSILSVYNWRSGKLLAWSVGQPG